MPIPVSDTWGCSQALQFVHMYHFLLVGFDLHCGEHSQTVFRGNLEVSLGPLLTGGLHGCFGGWEFTSTAESCCPGNAECTSPGQCQADAAPKQGHSVSSTSRAGPLVTRE